MIQSIDRTAVTFKLTPVRITKENLSKGLEWLADDKSILRVDLPPHVSTILGTRYLDDNPFDIVSFYQEEEQILISLEPMKKNLVHSSVVYWRKIGQNPKQNEINQDEDGQFLIVPDELFIEGEYNAEVLNDSKSLPRHLVCELINK
jgi:hypothetical protein|tara:strand:+ start:286 stop:726 length:441 start_codon:yes stop_codon:yes gene_type:complete